MEKKDNKEFETYLKDTVKEIGLESPSADFTDIVLSRIVKETGKSTTAYQKSLIAVPLWIVMGFIVLFLFFMWLGHGQGHQTNWFSNLGFTRSVNLDFLDVFSGMQVSPTFVYAFIGFAFFTGIQVLLLKQHFDRRYL